MVLSTEQYPNAGTVPRGVPSPSWRELECRFTKDQEIKVFQNEEIKDQG